MSNDDLQSERITVRIDGVPVEVYRGMKVRHALIALDYDLLRQAEQGLMRVQDGNGYEVGLDGALDDGSELFLKRK